MQVEDLSSLGADAALDTDLVIIGGGPAGLTIAREFFGTSTRVLILESGRLEENPRFANLNTVESIGEPKDEAQVRKRIAFHGAQSSSWSNESQRFGVRCRVLGGSSHAWAGKSAAFDDVDFAVRDWVPYSGWPFGLETLSPYLDRAAEVLNLGPNCYDDRLWELIGITPPQPQLDPSLLNPQNHYQRDHLRLVDEIEKNRAMRPHLWRRRYGKVTIQIEQRDFSIS